MSAVDTIYKEFKDAASVLESARELSLMVVLESHLRKTLLLSAASYFEYTITRQVVDFVDEVGSKDKLINAVVYNMAVSRQYHNWFDWKVSNANKFFSIFGENFKSHMTKIIREDDKLETSIKSFMEIGRDRNQLVHNDYASFLINKTPDEIYEMYKNASLFVSCIGNELRACSFACRDAGST